MKKFIKYSIVGAIIISFLAIAWQSPATTFSAYSSSRTKRINADSTRTNVRHVSIDSVPNDSIDLKYPFKDSENNPYSQRSSSPLYLKKPSNIKSDVRYNPRTNEYIFTNKVGRIDYRTPYSMDMDEYLDYNFDKSLKNYWQNKAKAEKGSKTKGGILSNIKIPIPGIGMIFGGDEIEIKPQGDAELIFGVNISTTENPSLPKNQQRTVTFDFDEKIQMGVTGKIGTKMELGINYNTKATFDFENKTKLAYEGEEDEIVKLVEAGNVSLPLSGSLITGSQSLFGIKTQLQFGKLTATTILSQQKGESSEILVEGGAQVNDFEISAGEYEANKHFFLGHYFKDNYDKSLKNLPTPRSTVYITDIEVWITNKSGRTSTSRNIVGFMDLAETEKNIFAEGYVKRKTKSTGDYPRNSLNNLYSNMIRANIRNIEDVTSTLTGISGDFSGGQDFEKIENARLLLPTEYSLNQKLGYISLNFSLDADEVLAVAYKYQVGTEMYQVGEFSNGSVKSPYSLIVKLIKGTSLTPKLPTWDLMMKNVYAIGAYQVEEEDFQLNVLYKDDKTGTAINYIDDKNPMFLSPENGGINGKVLLQVFNLDNLNSQNNRVPDGFFDFIDGYTINRSNGRIFFPVREPFGDYLRQKIKKGKNINKVELEGIADQFCFEELYSLSQSEALQVAEKNKFILKGTYRSSSGSEIMLNAMNIPQGSVKVTAGGAPLAEGEQYTVDYSMGRVTILDQALLESGTPIKISLESQSMFNIGTKTLIGTHLDYRISENFNIGGTILRLTEKPLTKKVNMGEEPISNIIWGINTSYSTEAPFLTRFVDRIPFIETKEKSRFTFEGEFAQLIPGHSKAIGKEGGVSFIDDFEGAKINYDIKSFQSWVLASAPQKQPDMFPYNDLSNDLRSGYGRAKFSWYNIMSDLVRSNSATPSHLKGDDKQRFHHWIREVDEQEIFKNKQTVNGLATTLSVFNMAYDPTQRGPYNYDAEDINADGTLDMPEDRWGGIMRKVSYNDFEASNIEFIEFWMMDPFAYPDSFKLGANNLPEIGDEPAIYFNIGNISEDILKDSRKSFEHGFPKSEDDLSNQTDTTVWGHVPTTQAQVRAFNPGSEDYQDLGLDGLNNDDERAFFNDFLNKVEQKLAGNREAYSKIENDPSSDDYHYFKGDDFDKIQANILLRYKDYNGMQGNSETQNNSSSQNLSTSATRMPDVEDINNDNTLSENESYFQYKVSLRPEDLQIGTNYITDIVTGFYDNEDNDANEDAVQAKWYQFKVPVRNPDKIVGNIQDFKSIRFIRMFMHGIDQRVVIRLAKLDLVRGEWRKYNFDLSEPGELTSSPQLSESILEVSAVNIEENGDRRPVNYVLPPDVDRVTDPSNPNRRELNEQSIVLKVIDLDDGIAKAAYKNIDMDMRQYKKLRMFVHAEEIENYPLEDNEVTAFIRLGSDYKDNYYEYEIPLKLTPHLEGDNEYSNDYTSERRVVWPDENSFEIIFEELKQIKSERNKAIKNGQDVSYTTPFIKYIEGKRVTIIGNPNLSNVKTIMLGVRNPEQGGNVADDDGLPKSVEIWMNELRLTNFDEKGGWAANARAVTKLADFATITIAGSTSKPGFGSIEKKVNERQKEEIYQYDLTSNFELGKFFPKKLGVKVPLHLGYSETFINPQYDPLNPDILLKETLDDPDLTRSEKDSLRDIVQDYTRRRSINITNARVDGIGKKNSVINKIVSGLTVSAGYNDIEAHDINTKFNITKNFMGSLGYNFSVKPKNVAPFKKIKLFRKPAFRLARDFNFYFYPSKIAIRGLIDRKYSALQNRNITPGGEIFIPASSKKDFLFDRAYDIKFDLAKGIKLDFTANNSSRIGIKDGSLDTEYDFDTGEYVYTNGLYTGFDVDTMNIWHDLFNIGDNTEYNHDIKLTYRVPINKIPLLNWINMTATYRANYNWNRGEESQPVYRLTYEALRKADAIALQPVLDTLINSYEDFTSAEEFIWRLEELAGEGTIAEYKEKLLIYCLSELDLGNEIKNSNDLQINTQFNLQNLYNKVGFLKKINSKVKSGKKGAKKYKTVTYERDKIYLKADKTKKITFKLKGEDFKAEFFDSEGEKIKVTTEVIGKSVKITPKQDYKKAKMVVTGKQEMHGNIFTFLGEQAVYMMMGVKNITVTYSQGNGTFLPGFRNEPKYVGLNFESDVYSPGIPFILGLQNDALNWNSLNSMENKPFLQKATKEGWLSDDPVLNQAVAMTHSTSWNIRATIEPIRDFKISLTATRKESMNVEEFWTADEGGQIEGGRNRTVSGNFSISTFTLKTALGKKWRLTGDNYSSLAFDNLKRNSYIIADRLAKERAATGYDRYNPDDPNPNTPGYHPTDPDYDANDDDSQRFRTDGYAKGYGALSQEVLIPAFLSAYTDRPIDNKSLSVFPKIPLPNWRVAYNGLTKIKFIKRYIKTLTINHSYRSTYTVGAYTSNPFYDFDQQEDIDFSYVLDGMNYYFIPEQEISSVSIKEDFSPLVNVDITWNNSLLTKFEYRKSRNLSLSLSNNRLTEMQKNEFLIGAGFRFEKVPINLKLPNGSKKFESDLNIRADLSISDVITVIRELDERTVFQYEDEDEEGTQSIDNTETSTTQVQDITQPTSGQRNIAIKASADYVLNERFSLRLYYDQTINNPKVSTSYRNSNTKFGISIRFTLIP